MRLSYATIKCAALEPAPVPGYHNEPQFDGTHTIVTGWVVKAGPEPDGYLNPCPDPHESVITGVIPVVVKTCVGEPSPQINHWMDPFFDATYSHVTGWTSRAGSPPEGYVNPCTNATIINSQPVTSVVQPYLILLL